MSTSSRNPSVASRARSRAKKACKTCNSRRIRCNVMEEQPCKNCKVSDVPCELIQSRRGKYERHPNYTGNGTSKQPKPSSATPSATRRESITYEGRDESNSYANTYNGSEIVSEDQTHAGGEDTQGQGATPIFEATPPITMSPNSTLNGANGTLHGADGTVFLGESSSISLVHTTQNSAASNHLSPKDRTRYPIPYAVSSKTSTTLFESRRKAARIEYLEKDGAFTFPSNDICEVLLGAYFSWFHPCFPILDRNAFFNSYVTKTVSPLLFQAVLFVGASHCNEKVMRELGYSDRQDTRNTMYNHAKDIYDADYETDKITVSQALFLMSFWRAGPLLEKDTRHWLGAAISLAQTKGMHRSSSTTTFSDDKLRKRIWWSLYVRDRQCSAALGLPIRIRDDDCDIEMLEPSDFEEDSRSVYPAFLGTQRKEHVLYAIQMAKLAVYFGKIVLREFSPNSVPRPEFERSRIKENLVKWESELSPEMRANGTADSFWASMLHLSYNNLFILLYRSAYIGGQDDNELDIGNIALQAACRNTRIIEDVLSQDMVQHLNVAITTSLFNSLCIHTICLRRSKNTARKLAEYRAQLCLLGLRELQKTWDVTNWVLQLFLQFLDQSTAKKLQIAADNEDIPALPSTTGTPRPAAPDGSESMDFGPSGPLPSLVAGTSETTPNATQGLDFASYLFGTKQAEDFSMFQLQPDLFSGDVFGGGLDQYYNSVLPKGDGMGDANNFR